MSANIHTRARQPQGRPTGGQFAEETRAASGLALDASHEAGACLTCAQPTETDANGLTYHLTIDGEYDHEADADHVARPDNGPQQMQVAPGPAWSAQEVEHPRRPGGCRS